MLFFWGKKTFNYSFLVWILLWSAMLGSTTQCKFFCFFVSLFLIVFIPIFIPVSWAPPRQRPLPLHIARMWRSPRYHATAITWSTNPEKFSLLWGRENLAAATAKPTKTPAPLEWAGKERNAHQGPMLMTRQYKPPAEWRHQNSYSRARPAGHIKSRISLTVCCQSWARQQIHGCHVRVFPPNSWRRSPDHSRCENSQIQLLFTVNLLKCVTDFGGSFWCCFSMSASSRRVLTIKQILGDVLNLTLSPGLSVLVPKAKAVFVSRNSWFWQNEMLALWAYVPYRGRQWTPAHCEFGLESWGSVFKTVTCRKCYQPDKIPHAGISTVGGKQL